MFREVQVLASSLAVLAGIVSLPAHAGSQIGSITAVSVDNNGSPYVFLVSGTHNGQPACATDAYWAVTNLGTDNAKSMVATILTAYATGRQVNVQGSGACPQGYPREAVNFIIAQ